MLLEKKINKTIITYIYITLCESYIKKHIQDYVNRRLFIYICCIGYDRFFANILLLGLFFLNLCLYYTF